MSITVKNISGSALQVAGLNFTDANQSQVVDYLSTDILSAVAKNLVSVTPTGAGIPTSAAGVAAAGTVDVGASFNQATLNANFATLVSYIAVLTAQVQAHESRLDNKGL